MRNHCNDTVRVPRRDVVVIAERDAVRASRLPMLFSAVRFAPRCMQKDRKNFIDKIAMAAFIALTAIELLLVRPRVVLLAWADPVLPALVHLRQLKLLARSLLVLLTRRTFRDDGIYLNTLLLLRHALRADLIIGYIPRPAIADRTHYVFLPFEPGTCNRKPPCSHTTPCLYIFSGGGHGRDFVTLIEACSDLAISIHLRTWLTLPPGSQFTHDNVQVVTIDPLYCTAGDPHQEESLAEWLAEIEGAIFVAIPLFASRVPRGITLAAQAIRCGKAIVATWSPGIEAYVVHEWNGIVVPPGDLDSWRVAVARLLSQPSERERFEVNAKTQAERYSSLNIEKKLLQICNELANDGHLDAVGRGVT